MQVFAPWVYGCAVLAGVLIAQLLPSLPDLSGFCLVTGLAVASARWMTLMQPVAIGLVAATWSFFLADYYLEDRLPESLASVNLAVTGVVSSLPETSSKGQQFHFDIKTAMQDGQSIRLPRRVVLSVYQQGIKVQAAERWRFVVRLKPPHGFQNPGGFDYEAYLFRQGIGARGYVLRQHVPERMGMSDGYSWLKLRARIKSRIIEVLPRSTERSLVLGLVIGDRSGLGRAEWRQLQKTGTAHLMAISGLHIGMVAGMMFFMIRWLWPLSYRLTLWLPAQKAAALGSSVAAFGYAGLAGFSIPTQRALIMLVVAIAAILTNRTVRFADLFFAAMTLVLFLDPFAVLDTGFWLSFLAVAIIAWAMTSRHQVHDPFRTVVDGLLRKTGGFLRIQAAVSLGLLPIVIARFQLAPWVSPLANLVAIPVFSLAIIPLLLLTTMLLFIPGMSAISGALLSSATTLLSWTWIGLGAVAGWPGAATSVSPPAGWTVLLAAMGLMMLLAPKSLPGRPLGVLWCLPLLFFVPPRPAAGEFEFSLLDVGQGLAAVVQTEKHIMVFDTGAWFSPDFDAGSAVVVPFLRSKGIDHLDALVISHGDNDHIGGASAVLESLPVARVFSSLVGQPRSDAIPCRTGMAWRWDGVEFSFLHPDGASYKKANNGACVLRVSSRWGSVLISADIEQLAETRLAGVFGSKLQSTVLVAPHHGSRTSSTPVFLSAVSADEVWIPAGYRNRYHHPHPDILRRYRDMAMPVVSTADSGAISRLFGSRLAPTRRFRNDYQRYWHHRPI
ncbi:MAG: DNA internalization-related competence protein ComEC/Rec2 [Gammaproteobacteria bacterium]|nr:DNA internalization-related competence protein ComEC/Rec2 [Gammaproteobacteria bacterium]